MQTTVSIHVTSPGDISAAEGDGYTLVRFANSLIERADVFLHTEAEADALIVAAVQAKKLLTGEPDLHQPRMGADGTCITCGVAIGEHATAPRQGPVRGDDAGLCNLPGPDGPCQAPAGHRHGHTVTGEQEGLRDADDLTAVAGFDLDSTIANTEHRRHLMPHVTEGSTWDDYAAACPGDTPMDGTIAVLRALWPTHQIHIVSGRSASARKLTEEWLIAHEVPWDVLHLRGPGDVTSNGTAKADYLLRLAGWGLRPVVFFEDWPPVAEIIRKRAGGPVVLINAGHGEYESGPALEAKP